MLEKVTGSSPVTSISAGWPLAGRARRATVRWVSVRVVSRYGRKIARTEIYLQQNASGS
jgi:hypothetical protein